MACGSHIVRRYYDDPKSGVKDFKDYCKHLNEPIEDFELYWCRVEQPSELYQELVNEGILDEWTGMLVYF